MRVSDRFGSIVTRAIPMLPPARPSLRPEFSMGSTGNFQAAHKQPAPGGARLRSAGEPRAWPGNPTEPNKDTPMTVTAHAIESPDYAVIKAKQNAAWASGDYARIGTTLQIVGETLAEAMDLRPGSSVL